jgi:uncharacterized caspase-like protein
MAIAAVNERLPGLVAVIVGIDGYEGRLSLRCATNDAVSLSEVLKKAWQGRYLRLETLVWPNQNDDRDGAAQRLGEAWGITPPADASGVTREGLLEAIRSAVARTRPNDTFLFYFAGHGCLRNEQPCFMTIRDGKSGQGVALLSLAEVQAVAAKRRIVKKVMILDCCQTSDRVSKGFFESLQDLAGRWNILTSCSPGEGSLEDVVDTKCSDWLEQGLFTASLVRGLRGEACRATGGSVSLMALAAFAAERVEVESALRVAEYDEQALAGQAASSGPARGTPSRHQHPVLLAPASAMGGPLQVVLAPAPAQSKQDLRRTWPSRQFCSYFRRFLVGPWPVKVVPKHMFREWGGVFYAGTILLTLLWFLPPSLGAVRWVFAGTAGAGSWLLWWTAVAFAVASNEDGWHPGGWIAALSYFVWGCLLLAVFGVLFAVRASAFHGDVRVLVSFGAQMLFIVWAAIIFGANASQAIIALAETVRDDERREIREAITAFRQFRTRVFNADFFNLVAMMSARPIAYTAVFLAGLIAVIGHTAYVIIEEAQSPLLWLGLLRNAFGAMLMAWGTVWYSTAFRFLQREVYKR